MVNLPSCCPARRKNKDVNLTSDFRFLVEKGPSLYIIRKYISVLVLQITHSINSMHQYTLDETAPLSANPTENIRCLLLHIRVQTGIISTARVVYFVD